MITSVYANNYKSLVNFKAEFEQLNVLIGKNGSGKSNVLMLLATLCSFVRGTGNLTTLFPISTLTRWMKSDIQTFELALKKEDDVFLYHLEIRHDREKLTLQVSNEYLEQNGRRLFETSDGRTVAYDDSANKRDFLVDLSVSSLNVIPYFSEYQEIREFRTLLDGIIICTPNPKVMQEQVFNDIYIPAPDFSNIASAYFGITQVKPEILQSLWDAMRQMDAAFVQSNLEVGPYAKYLTLTYQQRDVKCSYRFNELSDGEKMLFSLYLLLYGYMTKDVVILLDEPDNFLSLREIQPWCMELENACDEGGQCIMISHHPEVIDYFADENGIWVSRLHSGETYISDNPYYKKEEEHLLKYSELIARGEADET